MSPFFDKWLYIPRSRSVSTTRKIKRKTTEYGPVFNFNNSSDEEPLYYRRGRSRSRSRPRIVRIRHPPRSSSRGFIDTRVRHHNILPHPAVFYNPADDFGWAGYEYNHYPDHHQHDHHQSTCEKCKSSSKAPEPPACKAEKDKIAELEQKLKKQDDAKEKKKFRRFEKRLDELSKTVSNSGSYSRSPSRSRSRSRSRSESRHYHHHYRHPPRRTLEDIDLDLASCNADIHTVETIQHRRGWSPGDRGRPRLRSRSRSRSRSDSRGPYRRSRSWSRFDGDNSSDDSDDDDDDDSDSEDSGSDSDSN